MVYTVKWRRPHSTHVEVCQQSWPLFYTVNHKIRLRKIGLCVIFSKFLRRLVSFLTFNISNWELAQPYVTHDGSPVCSICESIHDDIRTYIIITIVRLLLLYSFVMTGAVIARKLHRVLGEVCMVGLHHTIYNTAGALSQSR